MERRDVLRSLAATGAAIAVDGCTQAPASASLTDPDIERMTLQMTGHPLASGHAQGVREMLATMRFKGKVDPDVQPSVAFDPEVDVE